MLVARVKWRVLPAGRSYTHCGCNEIACRNAAARLPLLSRQLSLRPGMARDLGNGTWSGV
jgi:hypothetical protein